MPNAKDPEQGVWGNRTIDPRTGAALPDEQLKIGSRFFYPLHYGLTLDCEAILLTAAVLACTAGMGWLALAWVA